MQKTIGIIGLGKMGGALSARLIEKKYKVIGYNKSPEATKTAIKAGAIGVYAFDELASALPSPRIVWVMVPHEAVDSVLEKLVPHLAEGDIVIDGGNSFYKDSIQRAEELNKKGIHFLDVGVSGGPHGARHAACLMIGGKEEIVTQLSALWQDMTAPKGFKYVGQSGAGHFVKMIHNGIEYGIMQALAEGFSLMKEADFDLDLAAIANLYNHGSVIESHLMGNLEKAFKDFGQDLKTVSSTVAQSGEGAWTIKVAQEKNIEVPVTKSSVDFRTSSGKKPSFAGKILSALRSEFGGHKV